MGLKLDKAFNAHRDKTREVQEGMCMVHAHDITKNHKREEHEFCTKNVSFLFLSPFVELSTFFIDYQGTLVLVVTICRVMYFFFISY